MTTQIKEPSIYIAKPFDQALKSLAERDYRIISLAENAKLRIQEGFNSDISKNGNYVREGVIYNPNENPILARRSPILDAPKEATSANRNGRKYFLSKEQLEKAKESGFYELPNKNFNIPTNRFGEEGLTVFAFGTSEGKDLKQDAKDAEKYGLFLRGKADIKGMPIYLADADHVNSQKEPFAKQMWFSGLDYRSVLNGVNWDLIFNDGVRGVPQETGEASSQKIISYTPKQIGKVLEKLKLSDLERQILDSLRNKNY